VTNESANSIKYLQEDLHSLTKALPTSNSRMSKRQIGLMFGLMGTAFSAINAVQINNLQKQSDIPNDKLFTLSHITQIQEDHLEHLEIENLTQDSILINAYRYNPAILATAAHQVVLQTADIINKVKSTIQQAQNNRLLRELL
jgi:hypothetical protein